MRVKRYVVNSMPDALEKIRVDLGKDAVILNTKPIRKGGLFGLFGKQQIEVIAAVDTKSPERAAVPVSAAAARQAYTRTAVAEPAEASPAPQPVPESVPPSPPQPVSASRPPAAQPKGTAAVSVDERATPASAAATLGEREAMAGQEGELARELRDMREMVYKLLVRGGSDQHVPEPFAAIRDRLLAQEVEEELTADILASLLKSFPDPSRAAAAEVRQCAARVITGLLQKGKTESPRIPRSVRYAYFLGPTGVGKTTTIAKLAAECVLKEKRRVGFITSDTYRIAAVEQLRTYANILNVPLEVVFSPREIEQAMERLAGVDLVLIDTAGRNYRNDEFAKGMKEYLRFGETLENYLVLSLTSKYSDIKPVVDNFSDVPIAKVIFTKSDETDTYGSILNVVHRYGLSLSYITTGQNVPDDVVVATPELVAEWILGDGAHA